MTSATTDTTSQAGAALAYADAAAGKTIYFTVDCVVPNNLPELGSLMGIEAFN